MSQADISRTFDVGESPRVSIGNIRGSIVVRPGETGQVAIQAIKHLDTGNAERTQLELIQDEDGHVRAKVRYENGLAGELSDLFSLKNSNPCKVDWVVEVPETCNLATDSVSGTVEVCGLNGELGVSTVSGNVALADLGGTLKLRSVSGNISGRNICGVVDANTVSGDISLHESALPDLLTHTVSGDCAFETTVFEGEYHFKSVSGDVALTLPPTAGGVIHKKSLSGRAHVAHPVTGRKHDHHAHNGNERVQFNGGETPIHFKSVSGDIHIASSGPFPAELTVETPAALPHPSRMDLLEKIARGELSVADGIASLEGYPA